MTITKRLLLTLSIALFGMLLVGAEGIWQLNQTQSRFDYIETHTVPGLFAMNAAQNALTQMRVGVLKEVLATPEQRPALDAQIARADRVFDETMAASQAQGIANAQEQQMLVRDQAAFAHYREIRNQVLAFVHANQLDAARAMLLGGTTSAASGALVSAMEDHSRFDKEQALVLEEKNGSEYFQSMIMLSSIVAVSFLISGFLAVRLFRLIRSGLHGIEHILEQVSASHDFTLRAPVERMDEIGKTSLAFNVLLEQLQRSFAGLRSGAHMVSGAAQQLSQTANQVSVASSAQSAAASCMASTIEQMTVSVNHVADQARETHVGTTGAQKLVEDGSNIIGQTIRDIHEISSMVKTTARSIHELETHSSKIRSVIDVIRDVADQTNLLALNAAIEAARAGESGRGFAVVADEVRKLAERTARSTQDIASTVSTMVQLSQLATEQMASAEQLVEVGVGRADNANVAIRRIGENASAAALSISEISAAIMQQGKASHEIARQVEQTSQMSEESNMAAQHAADSAVQLDRLAREQMAILGQYTI
jgi:methyl-accepting chemotaxis protein